MSADDSHKSNAGGDLEVIDLKPAGEAHAQEPAQTYVAEEGIRLDSDTPLIEQVLKDHRLDRRDKTLNRGCLERGVMLICSTAALALLLVILVWGLQ